MKKSGLQISKGEVMKMSVVSKRAPREEGVEEAKSIPMTVRASATIYEKLRVEADARGVSVPALIIYQMGEWLRGDELDRKSPAGDPAARRQRRGEEAEEAGFLFVCPDCSEQFPIDELVPDGVYLNCPGCKERSCIVTAEDPEAEDGSASTVRKGKVREEPKVPDVLKCMNDGGLLGDPCGWSGKKMEANGSYDQLTRTRIYYCPKCKVELAKARVFNLKDEVLTCPDCRTAYRRDELEEATSWGKEWLVCPGPGLLSFGKCGGKVIESAHRGKKSPKESWNLVDYVTPWGFNFFPEKKAGAVPPGKAKDKASRKAPGSRE